MNIKLQDVIFPPCGENVGLPTKRGANKQNLFLPLLPRLTAVLPQSGKTNLITLLWHCVPLPPRRGEDEVVISLLPQGREITTRGFTLIELLVVVLIIGILAAIAVPQYQKAIRKTHYTNMLTIIKPVIEAEHSFYLANGRYANNIDELDVQIPLTPGTCSDASIHGTNGIHVGTDYCLYLTGGYQLKAVFISFDGAKLGLSEGYAKLSGYQYLLNRDPTGTDKMKIHTLYCREAGISGGTPRKDFHCTGNRLEGNNWGAWYEMN